MASLVVEGFSEGNMKGVDYPAEGAAQETQEHPVEIAEDYLAIFRPFIEKAKVCVYYVLLFKLSLCKWNWWSFFPVSFEGACRQAK